MLGQCGEGGMPNIFLGEGSFNFPGLLGGVTARWTGGDLDGDLSRGGELEERQYNHIAP